ncbi:MFS transporter [Flexibacterium corallicola]|uniref:MFS transporter n=1 Tax=Flexibacterium corallicola TaxID=3037259 RepID=UPI00286EC62B|nr:MFS transporter [Pseudovibrio sp. M1P-2-3]
MSTVEEVKGAAAAPKTGGAFAWLVWVIATTFVVFLFSIQTGYAIVNGSMQASTGVTVAQVGIIAATYTWVFALCQFYGGAILDQLGARKVLPISVALVTAGVFIFANATDFTTLMISQMVLAIGSCTGFVGAGYVGGKWFGMAKFGVMFGLVQVVAAATSSFSQNLIGMALDVMDWRTLFNYVGFFGVFLFVVSLIYIRDPEPVKSEAKSVGSFLSAVTMKLIDVAKNFQVLVASAWGAATFGAMLALGVIWAPKIVMAHGVGEGQAFLATSMLWIGLAVGSAIVPAWSEKKHSRKLPNILGTAVQLAALAALLYVDGLGATACIALMFIFGFANASHMLAFSGAADVVPVEKIGTSAAVVNGTMFIFGGILMGLPGARFGEAAELGLEGVAASQFAMLPITVVLAAALIVSIIMKETHPEAKSNK